MLRRGLTAAGALIQFNNVAWKYARHFFTLQSRRVDLFYLSFNHSAVDSWEPE